MFLLRSPGFGIVGSMDKDKFLRAEYERIRAQGSFMAVEWRDSVERFVTDLWDMTPAWGKSGRFLGLKDAELGFQRGNVEWHYPRVRKPKAAIKPTPKPEPVKVKPRPKPKPTPAEKKAAELARVEAKRAAIAEEFRRWELKRAG